MGFSREFVLEENEPHPLTDTDSESHGGRTFVMVAGEEEDEAYQQLLMEHQLLLLEEEELLAIGEFFLPLGVEPGSS